MSCEQISFVLEHSWPGMPIGLEVWFDQDCIFNSNHVIQTVEIYHEFDAQPGPHQLLVRLKNKLPLHTVLKNKKIVRDARLTFKNFCLNSIQVQSMLFEHGIYYCDAKHSEPIGNSMGVMAFNGNLILNFESPCDQWMIDHYIFNSKVVPSLDPINTICNF